MPRSRTPWYRYHYYLTPTGVSEAGVPVTLASDDEGVARIDLSNEYLRAMQTDGLGYGDLKRFARNSLTDTFVAGESLWTSRDTLQPADACASGPVGAAAPSEKGQAFLQGSEKARLQWQLERNFAVFEPLDWLKSTDFHFTM